MAFALTSADKTYVAMKLFQREIVDRVKADEAVEAKPAEDNPYGLPARTPEEYEEVLRQKGLRMTLEGKNVSVKEHVQPEKDLVLTPQDSQLAKRTEEQSPEKLVTEGAPELPS